MRQSIAFNQKERMMLGRHHNLDPIRKIPAPQIQGQIMSKPTCRITGAGS